MGNDLESVHFARECLRAFHSELLTRQPSDALSEIMDVKIGQQCFKWLLECPQETSEAASWDLALLLLLAHFLVAEGSEFTFWQDVQKLFQEVPPTHDRSYRHFEMLKYQWSGRLIGDLARVHLTRDINKSADEALRTYLTLCQLTWKTPCSSFHTYWF